MCSGGAVLAMSAERDDPAGFAVSSVMIKEKKIRKRLIFSQRSYLESCLLGGGVFGVNWFFRSPTFNLNLKKYFLTLKNYTRQKSPLKNQKKYRKNNKIAR